jgi:hypothetical protein
MFWHTFGMQWFGGFGSRSGLIASGIRIVLCAVGLVAGSSGAVLAAQDEATPTLHVYVNLIQIPVLVLSLYHTQLPPIDASKFMVSIDSGAPFRPSHVRREGNDPISLAILLDATGPEDDLLPKMSAALASLAPLSLQPQDHVSIYAFDCGLTRTSNGGPAERDDLKREVDSALQTFTDGKKSWHALHCGQSVHLWDALNFVVHDLYRLPGRRVILAVTDGKDKGSGKAWTDVRLYAQSAGVAIFGLVYVPYVGVRPDYQDTFNSLCELTGGMVLTSDESNLTDRLKLFTKTVRERYIVEFPRPSNATAGQHDFAVTIEKSNAFIRSAGISVPIPDPALSANPNMIRPDSQAPADGVPQPSKPQ